MRAFSHEQIQQIISLANDMRLRGFGGGCAATAMAINRVLFKGEGRYVIVVNKALWQHNRHFAGHVLVSFQGVLWDADGRPKTEADIEHFGDLSQDPYYAALAKEYGLRWTKKRATTAEIFELKSDSEIPFGHDEVEEKTLILERAFKEFLKTSCLRF